MYNSTSEITNLDIRLVLMKALLFMLTRTASLIVLVSIAAFYASAQFLEQFEKAPLNIDSSALKGWMYYTGDGEAVMTFSNSEKKYSSINVDATKDKRGIWWALIRRYVSEGMDLNLLKRPHYALRIEARVRVSDAPKRINLHLNTQRTTDFHSHLMEFDIPDTIHWHTISMTTKDFDAVPGDSVYGQLALMDWGFERYRVDIDYFSVDIVNTDSAGTDKGVQVLYHPPIPAVNTFRYHLPAAADAMIDKQYFSINFSAWHLFQDSICSGVITAGSNSIIIMRWDLDFLKGKTIHKSGMLELTTASLLRLSGNIKDFGVIRIVEIIGGDPDWQKKDVTFESLLNGKKLTDIFNSQMIIDVEVNINRNGKTYATIPKPILQRLINHKTFGLAIFPLGAIEASFYSSSSREKETAPILHLSDK